MQQHPKRLSQNLPSAGAAIQAAKTKAIPEIISLDILLESNIISKNLIFITINSFLQQYYLMIIKN
jgi:hypothetical protein